VKSAQLTDVKNRLSHYLRLVARGETVTILDRGRPVARITRVETDDGELQALVAGGLARPPIAPLPRDFLTRRLPASRSAVSDAVIAERDDRF
jgi:prevent-host-death family protein